MKENIKDIRNAARALMDAPSHSGEVFRDVFGDELGAIYWSRMARAERDIEAVCDKLDELQADMVKEQKRIQSQKAKSHENHSVQQ